jgi:hypothetical protein
MGLIDPVGDLAGGEYGQAGKTAARLARLDLPPMIARMPVGQFQLDLFHGTDTKGLRIKS